MQIKLYVPKGRSCGDPGPKMQGKENSDPLKFRGRKFLGPKPKGREILVPKVRKMKPLPPEFKGNEILPSEFRGLEILASKLKGKREFWTQNGE